MTQWALVAGFQLLARALLRLLVVLLLPPFRLGRTAFVIAVAMAQAVAFAGDLDQLGEVWRSEHGQSKAEFLANLTG